MPGAFIWREIEANCAWFSSPNPSHSKLYKHQHSPPNSISHTSPSPSLTLFSHHGIESLHASFSSSSSFYISLTFLLFSSVYTQALPQHQPVDYPSFKLVIVGDGGTGHISLSAISSITYFSI